MITITCKKCNTKIPLISDNKKLKTILNSIHSNYYRNKKQLEKEKINPDIICPNCKRILIKGKKKIKIPKKVMKNARQIYKNKWKTNNMRTNKLRNMVLQRTTSKQYNRTKNTNQRNKQNTKRIQQHKKRKKRLKTTINNF